MRWYHVIGLAIGATIVGLILKSFSQLQEYSEHQAVRDSVLIEANDYGGWAKLEWYIYRAQYSEESDQMTITYILYYPGKGIHGDIDAFVEIYNREGTSWKNKTFTGMVVEFTRFCWCEIKISVDSIQKIWSFPKVTSDNIPSLGYITFEVPL